MSTDPGSYAETTRPSAPSRREVVRAYLVLPHAVPILAVLTATGAFACVVTDGWPGMANILCLLGAMLGGQLAVGAVNELVDVDLDRRSKPHKPIPAGLVSIRGAFTVTAIGLLLMVLFSLRFSPAAFLLCALGNGIGIAYSLWFKRSMWSWVLYLLAVPLIPIWVWTALDSVPVYLVLIYPLALPAVIALQIAQSLPDIASDRTAGVRTLAVVLGEARALYTTWGLAIVSIIVAAALAPWTTGRPGLVWSTCLAAVLLVGGNVLLWRRDAHRGIMRTFPLVAAAVVVLGVGWAASGVSP